MSNDVAKMSTGAVAAISALKRGIQNTRQAIPASAATPILRLGKDGYWVYGQGNVEVEEESRWAINPLSIQHGFVCWTDKKPGEGKNELLGEVYAPMSSAPVDMARLPDYGWPWKPATCVQLKCVSGDDEGETVVYKPSSVGGANVMQSLLDAIEEQLDEGTDKIVPIVTLESDHYQHKQYGKTYVPEFNIVDWVTMEGPLDNDEADDGEDGEEEAPEPKPARRDKADKKTKKSKPEPEPEDDEDDTSEEPDDDGDDAPEDDEPAEAPKTEGRVRRRRRAS